MLNVSKSYATVWKIEDKGKYCSGRISSSKKDKRTGNYVSSNWNVRFVGNCLESAKKLQEKDKITITNGFIENIWDKENKKNWLTLIVFDFELPDGGTAQPTDGIYTEVETPSELPF
jgi:hypothetical protein